MTPSIFRFYYHLWSVHPLVVFPTTIRYHHQLDTVVDSPSSGDLSEFIRVTPFLGPVSGSGMDMWPNLANQMWKNILRVIQGKPQEERISFCSTGCYHDWMGHLEVPQPIPAWECRWHRIAELRNRENLALVIQNQLPLEPLCLQLSLYVTYQLSLLLNLSWFLFLPLAAERILIL